MKRAHTFRTSWLAASACLCALAVTGCGSGVSGSDSLSPALHAITGQARGGQQPISGATVQLYGVSSSGYGTASTPLLTSTVTTDSNGHFTITGDYSCTGIGNVYLTVSGGNAGAGTNSAINIMTALGPCSSLSSGTFVAVDELTTVASVYALAGFMADYQNIGAPNTAAGAVGINNAFTTAANLVNTTTGVPPGAALPSNATIPASEINTLGNILSSCINSASGSASCTTLMAATGATDTIGAALGIANAPAASANTALYSLATAAGAPFGPTLASTPNDWTLAIKYSGTALSTPYGLAVDASGNVWVANESGNSVTKLGPDGSVQATITTGGIVMPRAVAVDKTGNIWIANTGGSSIVELNSSGTPLSGSNGFTAGSINAPVALAIDSGNNVWVANYNGNTVTALNSSGTAINSSPLSASGNLSRPESIAVDSSGNVWVSSAGNGTIAEFNNAGALQSGSGYTDGALIHPQGIALDTSNRAYVAAQYISALTAFNSSGTALSNSPLSGGGLVSPTGVAVDGAGSIWVTNASTSGSISNIAAGLGSTLSPSAGYGSLNTPVAATVDPSGNLWTANAGDSSVSEFVGLATPVTTPVAATVGP